MPGATFFTTSPANNYMTNKQSRQAKSGGDVNAAHPRPQHLRSRIVESERSQDKCGIECQHGRSGEPIALDAPSPLDVKWNERPQ